MEWKEVLQKTLISNLSSTPCSSSALDKTHLLKFELFHWEKEDIDLSNSISEATISSFSFPKTSFIYF